MKQNCRINHLKFVFIRTGNLIEIRINKEIFENIEE